MKGSLRRIGDVALPHGVWSAWSERLPDGGRRDVGSKEEAELPCASLGLSVDWDGYGFRPGHVVFPAKEAV